MNRKNDKQLIIDHENTIKKSYEFSLMKMNNGLTLNQMQLLAYAIFAMQQDGKTEFRKADFEKKFGLNEYRSEHAKADSKKLLNLKAAHENELEDEFEFWNIFLGMKYRKGLFTFNFSPKILPHLLDLKSRYIMTDLTVTSKFRSSYTWTFYDFLKAHYGYWYKTLSKIEILEIFGVEKIKTYQNPSEFKRAILDRVITEINATTEYNVQYEEQKEGRAIVGFTLLWNVGDTLDSASKRQVEDLKRICDIILEDTLEFIDLEGKEARERAKTLIRKTEGIRTSISAALTKEYAATLQNEAQHALNELLRLKNFQEIEREEKELPFYDWINEE